MVPQKKTNTKTKTRNEFILQGRMFFFLVPSIGCCWLNGQLKTTDDQPLTHFGFYTKMSSKRTNLGVLWKTYPPKNDEQKCFNFFLLDNPPITNNQDLKVKTKCVKP
jgi:hypothetical protein